MRLRAGNADRLQAVGLIDRLRQPAGLRRLPVAGLVGELDGTIMGLAGLGFRDRCSEPMANAVPVRAHESRRDASSRIWQRAREARRNMGLDPAKQRRDVIGLAGRHRE